MRYAKFFLMALAWMIFLLPTSSLQAIDAEEIHLRIAHFSPDSGLVDVYINDERVSEQLQFGTISGWLTLPSEAVFNISVVASGNADQILIETSLIAPTRSWNTLALIGLMATDTLSIQNIREDRSEILPGEARFAFFHAVQGTAPLDILLNDTVLFQLVGYPESNGTQTDNDGYVSVDVVASDYEVRIQENLSGQPPVEPFELSILPDRVYFIALIGTADNMQAVVVSDALSDNEQDDETISSNGDDEFAHVRFAHFSSGTEDLDFYLDGERLTSTALSFTTISAFFAIAPGEHNLSVKPANQPYGNSVVPDSQITVGEGTWTTLAATGLIDNDSLALQVLHEDFSNLADGDVRLTVIHALLGIGALDITANGVPLISLLGYPGSQGDNDGLATVDLLAGVYAIQVVNSSNEDDVFFDLGEISLAEGNHFLLALIRANPPFVFTYVPMN